jgi:seryl-tRNA synthetase
MCRCCTRFYYLRRAAALLEMALCNYALQKGASKGFLPMTTPDLVRESVLVKCGFQPRGDNTQVHPHPPASGASNCTM